MLCEFWEDLGMEKRIISLLLTITLLTTLFSSISVNAYEQSQQSNGISYNDLFMKYPAYLYNQETEKTIQNACNAYMNVIAQYETMSSSRH